MPKLTRLLIKITVPLALVTGSDFTLAAPTPVDVKQQSYVLRATGPLSDEYLRTVMNVFDYRTLSRDKYPDLELLTPTRIITVLCGSYLPAYWDHLREVNASLGLSDNADAVIGRVAYEVKWPACPYVGSDPLYKVKSGDTAFDIYQHLTGAPGEDKAVEQYFEASGIKDLNKLKVGQILAPGHVTVATAVKTSLGFNEIKSTLNNQRGLSTVLFSVDAPTSIPPSTTVKQRPRLAIAAGKIQSVSSTTYDAPPECKDPFAPVQPFNGTWLTNAYKDALETAKLFNIPHTDSKVTIADNGFFGANIINGDIVFSSNFPSRFFQNVHTGGPGIIGPLTASDETIYPINYMNGISTASLVSGHGTHITGLVLGGTDFQTHLSIFDRNEREPWLRLSIMNIGKGGDTLIPTSTGELSDELDLLDNSIINLSLEYEEPIGTKWNKRFLRVTDSNNLFVVSAGNDGRKDLTDVPYYPASLGGTTQANVITVAAHKPNGELAAFSNRSARSVDLAAPGCDLSSWLDDSKTITKVSGTSQAAAVVTFAAALLKSIDNMSPVEIKNRLMVSGDLLLNSTTKNAPRPDETLSRSKLNIPRALYIFDDYVKYTSLEDGAVHEILGQIMDITKVSCNDEEVDLKNTWALKASAEGLWLYKGKKTPKFVVQAPCLATTEADSEIRIKVRAELNAEGVVTAVNDSPVRNVTINELNQLVTTDRPLRLKLQTQK
ncbi:S8 family serine peptidase [Pseudomonas sp. TNT2022 ID233]|uniref:S8 family serine peptidase n=1 Tax=Pseudomonas aphyarum TaxID=2942629 RepID=UPI0023612EB9|nr:S8 family serine peptidase [Pseudomonas aphyarum]MDD1139724.1 S8 family serine peptidase [Pseudomonas aphyarum]